MIIVTERDRDLLDAHQEFRNRAAIESGLLEAYRAILARLRTDRDLERKRARRWKAAATRGWRWPAPTSVCPHGVRNGAGLCDKCRASRAAGDLATARGLLERWMTTVPKRKVMPHIVDDTRAFLAGEGAK